MELSKYIPTLEAVLFAGGEPVPISRLAAALELSEEKVEKTAVLLEEKLSGPQSGIELLRLGDSLQLATKKQYEEPVRTAFELRRSTPLSSAYIEQVRGVDCSGVVSSLVLKGLIEECGRLDLPGRPILYGTTDTFLRCFGLENLSALPPLPEEEHPFEKGTAETAEQPTLENFAEKAEGGDLNTTENSEKGE